MSTVFFTYRTMKLAIVLHYVNVMIVLIRPYGYCTSDRINNYYCYET